MSIRVNNVNFTPVESLKSSKISSGEVKSPILGNDFQHQDYTKLSVSHRYSKAIELLNNNFGLINPEEYIEEAIKNGNRTLVISDADYEMCKSWDS